MLKIIGTKIYLKTKTVSSSILSLIGNKAVVQTLANLYVKKITCFTYCMQIHI